MEQVLGITIMALLPAFQCSNCNDALEFLDKMAGTTADNCAPGTGTTLDIPINYTVFKEMTRTAILTSNFLTEIIGQNNGSFSGIDDETYYRLVKNNLAGQDEIFGSAIALAPNQHPKNRLFAPIAFVSNKVITAFDLSVSFDYTSSDTEPYYVPKNKNYESVLQVKTVTSIKGSEEKIDRLLVVTIEDGHWTKPYFDCGGGNIWIITYSSPILYKNSLSGALEFKGVAAVDKYLTKIDINQCDEDETGKSDPFLGIFRGTHRCQQTTQCQPKSGAGLRRGSYYCICKRGYYFPYANTRLKAFDGEDIEAAVKSDQDLRQFRCLRYKLKDMNVKTRHEAYPYYNRHKYGFEHGDKDKWRRIY